MLTRKCLSYWPVQVILLATFIVTAILVCLSRDVIGILLTVPLLFILVYIAITNIAPELFRIIPCQNFLFTYYARLYAILLFVSFLALFIFTAKALKATGDKYDLQNVSRLWSYLSLAAFVAVWPLIIYDVLKKLKNISGDDKGANVK
jgi:hypothetical protein